MTQNNPCKHCGRNTENIGYHYHVHILDNGYQGKSRCDPDHDAAQTLNKLQTCINAIGDRAVPTTAQWELLKTIATNH